MLLIPAWLNQPAIRLKNPDVSITPLSSPSAAGCHSPDDGRNRPVLSEFNRFGVLGRTIAFERGGSGRLLVPRKKLVRRHNNSLTERAFPPHSRSPSIAH